MLDFIIKDKGDEIEYFSPSPKKSPMRSPSKFGKNFDWMNSKSFSLTEFEDEDILGCHEIIEDHRARMIDWMI